MAEYIDKNKLAMHFADWQYTESPNPNDTGETLEEKKLVYEVLEEAIKAIGETKGISVVQCRDCRYRDGEGYCEKFGDAGSIGQEFFCAYGEEMPVPSQKRAYGSMREET